MATPMADLDARTVLAKRAIFRLLGGCLVTILIQAPRFRFRQKVQAFVEQRQKVERGLERFRVVSAMTSPIRKLVENIVQAIARDLPTHAFHTLGDVGLLGASRLCLWVFASRSPICPGLAR